MSFEGAFFGATIVGGMAAVWGSSRGNGKVAFLMLTALFLLTSWIILSSDDAIPGTDGQAMLGGLNFLAYVFSLLFMFVLRKRTDAIF